MAIGSEGERIVREEQELDIRIFNKLREWLNRSQPHPDLQYCDSFIRMLVNELLGIISPRQEVMSDEESRILELAIRQANYDMVGQDFYTAIATHHLRALVDALVAGRISKPQQNLSQVSRCHCGQPLDSHVESKCEKDWVKLEYCQCKPEERILCRALECNICHKCNLTIPPKQEEKIKELVPWGEMVPPEPMNAALERTMNKINKLVDAVNKLRQRQRREEER